MTKLAGKVALVTGGARGIGRAICEAYAAAGAMVVAADINEDDARKTAKAVGGMAVAMDVADMDSISAGIAAVKAEYAGLISSSIMPASSIWRRSTRSRMRIIASNMM